jgi:serine/threonine protein kinase
MSAPFHPVLSRVVIQTLSDLCGLVAGDGEEAMQPRQPISWSWVKVVDPTPGTVVIGIDPGLAAEVARICFGAGSELAKKDCAIRDVQAEFTEIIAGRLAQAIAGDRGLVTLDIPRTGAGAPEVSSGDWTTRRFQVGGRLLQVSISGMGLVAPCIAEVMVPTARMVEADGAAKEEAQRPMPVRGAVTPGSSAAIGHYRIIDHLGSGGMGVVYKAFHDSLHRHVALKVMRPDLAANRQFVDRFLREGRVAAHIDHPNVVPVYDAGFHGDQLYLAMRYMPGGDLAMMLQRGGGTIPEDRALMIVWRCLHGMKAIAEAGMIHRDLKPANILLEANGTPRLADLGLVRMVNADEFSEPGVPHGTPNYMSPEQAQASRCIDIRSDIFSLGATLYCMVCGEPPFSGDSPYEVVAKVIYAPTPDPRTRRPSISADTVALVMKAMNKDRAARFQTLEEFEAAVMLVLQRHRQVAAKDPPIRPDASSSSWMRRIISTLRPPDDPASGSKR